MRFAVFFLYLCAFLLAGNSDAMAGIQQAGTPGIHAWQGKKDNTVRIVNVHGRLVTVHRHRASFDNSTDTQTDDNYSVNVDDDRDDDGGSSFVKKCRLPFTYQTASIYPSVLSYGRHGLRAPPASCVQYSYKYILQRTLRI